MHQAKRPRKSVGSSEDEAEQLDCGLLESSSSCESLQSEESLLDPELEADMEQYRKPDASYIELIAKAILESPGQKLRLHDLYETLEKKHPYFQVADAGWRNSVRHNLSLHECFCKTEKCGNGKGHYWTIHPIHLQDFQAGDFRRKTVQSRARQLHQQQQQQKLHQEAGVGGVLPPSPLTLTSPSTILSPLGGQTATSTHFHFPTPPFHSPPIVSPPIPISPVLPTSPSLMYNPATGSIYYTAFPFPFMCGTGAPYLSGSAGYPPPPLPLSSGSCLSGSTGYSPSSLSSGSNFLGNVPLPPPPAPTLPSSNSSTVPPQLSTSLHTTSLDVPPPPGVTRSLAPGAAVPQSTGSTSGPPILPPVCCINAGPPPPASLAHAASSSRGARGDSFGTTSTLTAGIRSHILQENLKQSPFSIDSILASQQK